jgi:hypothetical protein
MSEQRTEQATAPVIEELPESRLILVICRYRYFHTIKQEFEDWQSEGLQILACGASHKAHDGFFLITWRRNPVHRRFLNKLRTDVDIFDYVPITFQATTM